MTYKALGTSTINTEWLVLREITQFKNFVSQESWIMHSKGICSQVLIDTLDWNLEQFSIDIPINTQLTLDRHLINSRLIVGQVSTDPYASIKISQLLTDCRVWCQWSINQVSTEVSMECQSSINQGYRLRVSINTWPWMPLVHIIQNLNVSWGRPQAIQRPQPPSS